MTTAPLSDGSLLTIISIMLPPETFLRTTHFFVLLFFRTLQLFFPSHSPPAVLFSFTGLTSCGVFALPGQILTFVNVFFFPAPDFVSLSSWTVSGLAVVLSVKMCV